MTEVVRIDGQEYQREVSPLEMSPSIGKIAEALAKAQCKIAGAKKDSVNPHFKSRYADLAAVWEACQEAIPPEGIAIVQAPSARGSQVTVTTLLAHSSGEWFRSTLTLTAQQGTPQAVGSAITYGRRYGLSGMAGIAPEDDDGEAAEGRTAPKKSSGAPVSLDDQMRASIALKKAEKLARQQDNIESAKEILGGGEAVMPFGDKFNHKWEKGAPLASLEDADLKRLSESKSTLVTTELRAAIAGELARRSEQPQEQIPF